MAFLFRDETAPVSRVIFSQQSPLPAGAQDGECWYDAASGKLKFNVAGTSYTLVNGTAGLIALANITPVTATDPSAATALQTKALGSAALNAIGNSLEVNAAGVYTTASGQTPTLTFDAYLGTVKIATWVSAATTASSTAVPWNVFLNVATITTGATGTVEAHGKASITLGTTAAAATATYNDVIVAASSAIDLTSNLTFKLQVTASSANAGNSVVQRLLTARVFAV